MILKHREMYRFLMEFIEIIDLIKEIVSFLMPMMYYLLDNFRGNLMEQLSVVMVLMKKIPEALTLLVRHRMYHLIVFRWG